MKIGKFTGSVEIDFSNMEKVLYPQDQLTKEDLLEYYQKIADTMLLHTANRPMSMQRFPDGIGEYGFYEKEVPDYFPDWVDRVKIRLRESGEVQQQVLCNQVETLLYLVNQACIVWHLWLLREDQLDYPDKLIFDLDPPTESFEPVREASFILRRFLKKLNLECYVMTSGSKGLHVVVPLNRESNFDEVRAFSKKAASLLAKQNPNLLTDEVSKNRRKGRVFIDTLRNAYGQTSVSPYSLRALPGAPVAAPLDWHELDNHEINAQSYNIRNIFRRLGQKADPWEGMYGNAQTIRQDTKALLDEMIN